FFFFQAEDGIRDYKVTGVQTCALPIFVAVALAVAWVSRRLIQRAPAPAPVALAAGAAVLEHIAADEDAGLRSTRRRLRRTIGARSEERRVGKECRRRGAPAAFRGKEAG